MSGYVRREDYSLSGKLRLS